MRIAPKKSLGQNFLTDKNIALNIVNLLGDIENRHVLEIGPGPGAITRLILAKKPFLTSVELDMRAVDLLNKDYAKYIPERFNVVHSDILKFNFAEYAKATGEKKLKVIGNIPYNISSEIFFYLFENCEYIERSVLTIQREVARRLVAGHNSKEYGILTVALSMLGVGKIAFDIQPESFFPKPNVVSSVISFDFFENRMSKEEFASKMKFVRAAFSQRRKILGNSLKTYIEGMGVTDHNEFVENAKKAGIDYFMKRAEQLSLQDFERFYDYVQQFAKA